MLKKLSELRDRLAGTVIEKLEEEGMEEIEMGYSLSFLRRVPFVVAFGIIIGEIMYYASH